MRTLRFTQSSEGAHRYRIEVALEGGGARQVAVSHFNFGLSAKEQEEVRWYLEEYLQYPHDPAPQIAARIENRMIAIGNEIFGGVFHTDEARDLWAALRPSLGDTRVEIVTELREASTIPWELMRDPTIDTPLALFARAFVRTHPRAALRPHVPQTISEPVRVLLVISRPRGGEDVPFRSVASRLIKSATASFNEVFQLDVLRPPTFERLSRVLREAKADGNPYHIVHFDGHGVYQEGRQLGLLPSTHQFVDHRPGQHGYLLFESRAQRDNIELVDGPKFGRLLAETKVPFLILNACRSAHADPPNLPVEVNGSSGDGGDTNPPNEVRAFGSLAQEVMDAGAAGVVAMRYNVYVVTAAQFVADLYTSLVQGRTLGEAVTLGRKQLHDQPLREIAYDPVALQDWVVPVVYEAAPVVLFPEAAATPQISIAIQPDSVTPGRGDLDSNLPPSPDVGFWGRDETLLDLDRAFDTQTLVLLHAYAGDGKTTTAAEFARWYTSTGGVDGPVLFTSFEQHRPLPRVLDTIERIFGGTLEQQGVHWLTLSDAEKRDVALDVLRQIPVLWVWDNVEQIAGFPGGTPSAWTPEEQQELVSFLRAARDTRAKFLLTSRRDEHNWLGDLPARVALAPMPMQERAQLARALANKHGHRLSEIDDWRPLLRYTQGNPLTITVVVREALRAGLHTKQHIEDFVTNLRNGEAELGDDESQGRARSLGASLDYGLEHAFNREERKRLALLCFYQGFVAADVFSMMGRPESWGHLYSMRGFTYEASIELLDRAAEVGLLTTFAHGDHRAAKSTTDWHFLPSHSAEIGRYYTVHPAIPWHLKKQFDRYYPEVSTATENPDTRTQATSAFVEVMATVAGEGYRHYRGGNPSAVDWIAVYEANLLHAHQLALAHNWWDPLISVLQGIRALYEGTSRWAEWSSLVYEVVPHFTDPDNDGPLPGYEVVWQVVTEFRIRLTFQTRHWSQVQRLLRLVIDTNFRQLGAESVESFIAQIGTTPREAFGTERYRTIVSMSGSLHELGLSQWESKQSDCIQSFKQCIAISRWIGDSYHEKQSTYAVGLAYATIDEVKDLQQAENWFHQYSNLLEAHETLARSFLFNELGNLARERAHQAQKNGSSPEEVAAHFQDAVRSYHRALNLTPPLAHESLSVKHSSLGVVYNELGSTETSLQHLQEAIRLAVLADDAFRAGNARHNAAITLLDDRRYADARLYAEAALNDFRTFGHGAAAETTRAHDLLAEIERSSGDAS